MQGLFAKKHKLLTNIYLEHMIQFDSMWTKHKKKKNKKKHTTTKKGKNKFRVSTMTLIINNDIYKINIKLQCKVYKVYKLFHIIIIGIADHINYNL